MNYTQDFIRQWAKKIKAINLLGGKCENCQETSIFVLEFHHIDPSSKIDWLIGYDCRWSKLESEVKKCRLLCRNCHRQIHAFGTERNLKAKTKLLQVKGVIGCEKCGYSKSITVLDFHHRNESDKKFQVNSCDIRRPHIHWEDILAEIDKTDVLCCNCHTLVHSPVMLFEKLKDKINQMVVSYKELQPKLDVDTIANLLSNGEKQIDIARKMKCSKSAISGIIKHNNLHYETKEPPDLAPVRL